MKELIKNILTIGKVLGALGVIATGVLWLDSKFDNQSNDLSDIKDTVEYINIEQSLISEEIQSIHDTLDKFEGSLIKQNRNIQSLSWAVRNIDNFSSEQLEEILSREFTREREYTRTSDIEAIPIE